MADDLFSKNYFAVFNQPVNFNIDLNAISIVYRDLQKAVHPDRYASGTDFERRLAMQQTSFINQAFQTLKDPIARALYLLQLRGISHNPETDTTMDAAFLMEQMELREAISDVRDHADPLAKLDKFNQMLRDNMAQLSAHFASQLGQQQLDAARESVRKMQFVAKAQTEIAELSEQLENELL